MARIRAELDVKGQRSKVLELVASEPPGWRRDRLLAVKHGLESEKDLDEISQSLGRARSTIQEWFDKYRTGGIEELLRRSSGKGVASEVTPEILEEMAEMLRRGEWRTGPQAKAWLKKEHGIIVKGKTTIYTYLKKLGARLKVPRPVHRKKDHDAAEAFKEQLAEKLEALNLPSDPFEDIAQQDRIAIQATSSAHIHNMLHIIQILHIRLFF